MVSGIEGSPGIFILLGMFIAGVAALIISIIINLYKNSIIINLYKNNGILKDKLRKSNNSNKILWNKKILFSKQTESSKEFDELKKIIHESLNELKTLVELTKKDIEDIKNKNNEGEKNK